MTNSFAPDALLRHAGFVMAQAAGIVSNSKSGEFLCPFAIFTKGDSRESIAFESATQDEAIREGWDSLEKHKARFDLWAFAHQGSISGSGGQDDVLIVAAWAQGMPEPVIFVQRFLPEDDGGFALLGPAMAQKCPPEELEHVATRFMEGVLEHPQGNYWQSWRLP